VNSTPVTVTVTATGAQLPNGGGGITVVNDNPIPVIIGATQELSDNLVTLQQGSSISLPGGSTWYASAASNTTILVLEGLQNYFSSNVTIDSSGTIDVEVTNSSLNINGTVDVGSLPDVTIANATLNVGGTVDIGTIPDVTIASGTIDVGTLPDVTLASGTVVNVGSGTIDIGTLPDVTIANATLTVGGTVDIGTIPDVTIASGTIDVGTLPDVTLASGTVVNVGSGTIDIGTLPDVTIASGTIDIGNTPSVTLDGPVGISQGSQVVISNAGQYGQTTPSPVGSVTDGNATLSSTDYNLISWAADSLPVGSPGNLVYDSNLAEAIAAVGPTWNPNGAPIGTGNGEFTVINPGTDDAEWIFHGSGESVVWYPFSQVIDVTPGSTYTLSADIDGTETSGAGLQIILATPGFGNIFYRLTQAIGGSGVVSGQVVIPSGVTQVVVSVNTNTASTPTGETVSWSQIQFTETSTVQPYEPGPLWTYDVYRDAEGTYERIGSTTALALEDTGQAGSGQPPSVNTSNPLLPSPAAPTVTAEGTTGSTTYTYAITAQTPSAQGTVVLGANPGVTIGTIDIADGATVQIAAGTAAIGTVDLAAGASVDATIQNATLDVTGSTINVDGATQLSSSFGTVNASAQDTVTAYAGSTDEGGPVTVTLIPSPSSSERVQLFSGGLFIPPDGGIHLETTSGTIISVEADNGATDATAPSLVVPLQYDGAVLPAGEGVNAYGVTSSASINYSVIAT